MKLNFSKPDIHSIHFFEWSFKVFIFLCLSIICMNNTFAQDKMLKDVFKNHFLIGAALNTQQFSEEDTIASMIVKKHFNSVTSENVLKWKFIHPLPDKYDFAQADGFIEFGEKHNMFTIGHTLVWHNQTPEWVFKDDKGNPAKRETLIKRMKDHIETVVGHYKGKIKGWDVVNEAIDEDGTLRQTEWMKIIGEDYIRKAFEFARTADPDAELYYNDYSLENEPKRNGTIELIKKLKAEGIKIDGVGLQGHYKLDWPTTQQLDSTIKAFSALGLKVMITELDIDVLPYTNIPVGADVSLDLELGKEFNPYPDELPANIQKELADRYAELFKVFIENDSSVSRVTFWGVTDKESWLHNWPIKGRTSYPLLFDKSGNPKPAFDSVVIVSKKNN